MLDVGREVTILLSDVNVDEDAGRSKVFPLNTCLPVTTLARRLVSGGLSKQTKDGDFCVLLP